MNIQRICFLGTRTRNFDTTASFFRDVLGLNLGHAEPGWSVFRLPSGHSTRGISRSRRSSGTVRKRVERHVGVADNGNESRASPVHHAQSIWRHLAESLAETQPHG
jgi:catechol 2,3-dioxygenase-like lactoylglutathione lyase family enzyme